MIDKSKKTTPANEIITDEEGMLFDFHPSNSSSTSRSSSGAGVMTLVNSSKHGKRVALSKELLDKLDNPDKLQVSLGKDAVAFGKEIPRCKNSFPVKKCGNKGMLYSYGLVKEIIEEYELDFSDKVCLTFHRAKYIPSANGTIAIVYIND